ncbi:MAG: hypothetical protein DRI33_04900 [Caldiserica bacterium]|nr:MAG: hypothetical protein DRI33_04900 [Caldisericota bacterium]
MVVKTLVLSVVAGKGGVGKTTISVAIAKALAEKFRVGLFDCDITGANSHKFLEIKETYDVIKEGNEIAIKPAIAEIDGREIEFMSIALVSESYVGWKPGEHGDFVSQLLEKTMWNVDYLIIDSPPGFHDEITEALKHTDGVILVTLPSELSHLDAKRTAQLLADLEVPAVGQIINFSSAVCPKCGERIELFKGKEGLDGMPVIQKTPFVEGLPNIDVDRLLKAIENPVKLKPTIDKSAKRNLLKMFLKGFGRSGE